MKKYLIVSSFTVTFILGFIYYKAHISIWGFNIPKSELNDVIIYTKENGYLVTDSKYVLELSKELSNMEKMYKIQPGRLPLAKGNSSKFTGIIIQTRDKTTYGGSFWEYGNDVAVDSNGYYWMADKDLIELMDKALIDAQRLF